LSLLLRFFFFDLSGVTLPLRSAVLLLQSLNSNPLLLQIPNKLAKKKPKRTIL
ncbi:hypothetical protein SLEP1_g60022, partial [Rubroshorea leprosula]